MNYRFIWNERMGIRLPVLDMEWEEYSETERHSILAEWEDIRGRIPSRIMELEQCIIARQNQLYDEADFTRSCELNWEIADLASRINDLHLWYRVNQEVQSRMHG
ncbi:hypothetical protein [Paenibacillus gansuensis]|uniref:Uncharacterized protein n=1 Tax=Paenibacillus gansuensis TaxID=306542 RepID=A0ABW5PGZ0_9BACL